MIKNIIISIFDFKLIILKIEIINLKSKIINILKDMIYEYINDNDIISSLSPYKEILRYHIITGLNQCFYIKLKELNNEIYDINELIKNNNCKLNELINRWCWHQYNNPTCVDTVIPYLKDNNYEYDSFIRDLNYILNVYDTKNAINKNDLKIIELKKIIEKYLEIEYFTFSKRPDIDLEISREFIDNRFILNCQYKNNNYKSSIHIKVYNMLKMKLLIFGKNYNLINNYYGNIDDLLDKYIYCLIYRYSYMESGNQQLAINENIKKLFKSYGVDFELFGSAINTISNNYCSLFFDIEKFFGSKGNFFNIKIKKGIYWCNPPYDDTIMTNTANKLINLLENSEDLGFLITIPIWDIYTQNKIKNDSNNVIYRNYNKESKEENHLDFKIYSSLKKYIKDELIIPKHVISYFNYRKFSHINSVNTYMLIVYNNLSFEKSEKLHKNFDKIMELNN